LPDTEENLFVTIWAVGCSKAFSAQQLPWLHVLGYFFATIDERFPRRADPSLLASWPVARLGATYLAWYLVYC
jgi:hypothetical protein